MRCEARHLLSRNFDFDIAAWCGCVYHRNNPVDVMPQERPLGVSKDHHSNGPSRQVLLKFDVLVGRDEYLEACCFCGIKQVTVSERSPSTFNCFDHDMTGE